MKIEATEDRQTSSVGIDSKKIVLFECSDFLKIYAPLNDRMRRGEDCHSPLIEAKAKTFDLLGVDQD